MLTLALLLSLNAAAPLNGVAPTKGQAAPQPSMCDVTPELRVGLLHNDDAAIAAARLGEVLALWGCVKVFSLPVAIPMMGDALPEGASRLADSIGVDWIITVSPGFPDEQQPVSPLRLRQRPSVTARLIEVSNLQVMAAEIGDAGGVAAALLGPVRLELQQAATVGARITLVLDGGTYNDVRALENDLRGSANVVSVGGARLVDGRGLVTVLYLGGVGRLADLLAGQSIGLRKDELDVVAVKLRRIEMRLVTPEPDSSSVVVPARASITAPMP